MKSINIAEKSHSLEELDNEIKERQELRNQMVGTLYPGIVQDEIFRLVKRRVEIESIVRINYEYYGKRCKH